MSESVVPREIFSLAAECVAAVRDETGVELDYTTLTLPVLDHYCRSVRRGPRWTDGARQTAHSVGAYFGEVVRRHFGARCRWVLDADGLHAWRLEFEEVFLCFNPLGSALESLLDGRALGWNAEFVTLAEAEDSLRERLDRLPGVSERDFFTLSVRIDVLETICEFLEQWEHARDDSRRPYGTTEYESRLAQIAADATAAFE
jgi:hypothetical protein